MNDGNYERPQTQYTNVIATLKLPANATYTGTDYTYDASTHTISKSLNNIMYTSIQNVSLIFSGVAGDPVQRPNDYQWSDGTVGAIRITGKEGDKIERSFTYDLPRNGVLEDAKYQFEHTLYTTNREVLKNYDGIQELLCPLITNTGTKDAKQMTLSYVLPDGLEGYDFYVPKFPYRQNSQGTLTLTYTTNANQTTTVVLDQRQHHYTHQELGVPDGQYIREASLSFEPFVSGDYVRKTVGTETSLCLLGKARANVDESQPVVMNVTVDGTVIEEKEQTLVYKDVSYINGYMPYIVTPMIKP